MACLECHAKPSECLCETDCIQAASCSWNSLSPDIIDQLPEHVHAWLYSQIQPTARTGLTREFAVGLQFDMQHRKSIASCSKGYLYKMVYKSLCYINFFQSATFITLGPSPVNGGAPLVEFPAFLQSLIVCAKLVFGHSNAAQDGWQRLTIHGMATPQAMQRGPGAQNSKFRQRWDRKHAYPPVVIFA